MKEDESSSVLPSVTTLFELGPQARPLPEAWRWLESSRKQPDGTPAAGPWAGGPRPPPSGARARQSAAGR